MRGRKKDLTGKVFGKLTVIKETPFRVNKKILWECKCDCGNTTFVKSGCLISGDTTSCGCKMPWIKPYIDYSKEFGMKDYLKTCEEIKSVRLEKITKLRKNNIKTKEISKLCNLSIDVINKICPKGKVKGE